MTSGCVRCGQLDSPLIDMLALASPFKIRHRLFGTRQVDQVLGV
jgi:hypothetical protein